jgi:hypothetical protein
VGLQLKSFSSELQGLTLKLPSGPVQPGTSIQLPVVFTPVTASPVLAERMTITTSNPQQAELVIAVYGNAKAAPDGKEAKAQQPENKVQH